MGATLEQIDKLRERANVGYEEAKEAMTLCNDDFLSALIYLEKLGKVNVGSERNVATPTPPPPPPPAPPWAARRDGSQWGYGRQGYSYDYPPFAYNAHARRFHEKMRRKAEHAHMRAERWAHKCDRRFDEAREEQFWNDFWFGVKRFFRLSIYGICMIPIVFFAALAALFTKFTFKIERKDGKDVPINDMLSKIAKFADDAAGDKNDSGCADEKCAEACCDTACADETPVEPVAEIEADTESNDNDNNNEAINA